MGRNGTGKTTLLRALSGHQIRGTPPALQILHVEQEVGSRPAHNPSLCQGHATRTCRSS